jgi:histidinol-phosphatase (PHP family)
MYKENYHTHMFLCKHATGTIEDYIKIAIAKGYTHLGISDHGPLEAAGFPRMSLDEFYRVYLKEYKHCKEKYKDQIQLYIGLELEYLYGRDSYYKELSKDLDYLILGNHYYSGFQQIGETSSYNVNSEERLEEYVSLIEHALDTKLFQILAHPDLFLAGYPSYDIHFQNAVKRICEACIKNHVYLECNVAGIVKGFQNKDGIRDYIYPNKEFFKIASSFKDLKVIVSSDCHNPIDLEKNIAYGYSLLEEVGIEPILHPLSE